MLDAESRQYSRTVSKLRIVLIAGARPEAVTPAPVADRTAAAGRLEPCLLGSGLHPEMIGQAPAAYVRTADRTRQRRSR